MKLSKCVWSEDGQVVATSAQLDELFILMQSTEKDKEEARKFIEKLREQHPNPTSVP